ncbi:carotenoid 1,2-hydratase [Algihabitans albus]|uniref:carotenoid 1,2-hydratase n=1 Tax=Algihabitans albus TaxID=2164067 RepID=UPI001F443A36|nr:carotenoid 1,2-hydratase [Algihabitans albus]
MTERGRPALERSASRLSIGPSALRWDGSALTVEIDEIAVPLPRRVRGRVRLLPEALTERSFVLDGKERHRWWPLAPVSRIEVELDSPDLHWSGPAYLDSNGGEEPLETGFRFWAWSRAAHDEGTTIAYDAQRRDGSEVSLGLDFDRRGEVAEIELPPQTALRSGLWGVRRPARGDRGEVRLVRTFEDAPFYTRSQLTGRLCSREVEAVHESLDLDRFANPLIKLMLPFRMPRRPG